MFSPPVSALKLTWDHSESTIIDDRIFNIFKVHILNLASILEAAGSGLEKAVKTTCFLQNMTDFAAFNEVYARFFPNKPARSCVEVAGLPKGALVEIEVIAELGK